MALDSELVMLARAEQEKLRMKPRAYFGIKLYNGARAIGVILFETEQDAFCKSKQQLMDWKESSMVMLLERALLLHSTYGQTSEPGTEE